MKTMSEKQYLATLDEEFIINDIIFDVAWMPDGWCVYLPMLSTVIERGLSNKKIAIEKAEKYANGKYNSKTTKFL
jgi:hypothetical protein